VTKAVRASLRLAFLAAVAALALCSCAQGASSVSSTRYALVYGVENYPGSGNDLTYPKDDADSMGALLGSQGWKVYKSTDSEATKARIQADIASIASIATADSTVLLYYSGHGTSSGSTSYMVPYDSVSAAGQIVYSNLLSATELQSMLKALSTDKVIVVLDCCYSGGFVDSNDAIDASPDDYLSMKSYSAFSAALANFGKLLASNASASGATSPLVISAAGSQDLSYDGDERLGQGVFTYYLLQSATKGDSDSDGVVTTTEAFAYATEYVKAWDQKMAAEGYFSYYDGDDPFLPHISGGTRDFVLFSD
jgi:uncharacterized caspase-like protein